MNGTLFLLNRRDFLRLVLYGSLGMSGLSGILGADYISRPLWEQYVTWQAANCDADTFVKQHAPKLALLHFGATLCPDYQLMAAEADPDRTIKLLQDYFGCAHVRLGMRWNTHAALGIGAYDRWIEALLNHGIKTVPAYGLKAPFPPETHFPPAIEKDLAALGAPRGSTIHATSPLGKLALDYSQTLLDHLEREFGLDSFYGFNPENEFDAHYGTHALAVGADLLRAQVQLLYHPHHRRRLLLNSALISPPLQPASLSTVINNALALRQEFPTIAPIVGADIYEETGAGRITANIYIDTFAGVRLRHGDQLIPNAKKRLAAAGIPLEVTEFQISDWFHEPRRYQPGSRIHTQYLLLRMMDYLVDKPPAPAQEPFVVRLWEMSMILRKMLEDERFFYSNDTYPLIQRLNQHSL
ncbi:MAG: hypothetical protein R3C14_35815 [Caldilineaceae bacterium]